MDPACPDVDGQATASHTRRDHHQSLTPSTFLSRLRRRCVRLGPFARGPHPFPGRPVAAARPGCYRSPPRDDRLGGGCGPRGRHETRELRDCYRGECTAGNAFACRLTGCGHVGRAETIVGHYESAHGPFAPVVPTDPAYPDAVCFVVPTNVEVVKRIFNGYFYFFVKSPMPQQCRNVYVSMVNINPTDRTRYTYTASVGIIKGEMICKINVSLIKQHE